MLRATSLRDARESARSEYVQRAYDSQWRDQCDDARSLDSIAMTKYMNAERVAQMQNKLKMKQEAGASENDYLAEWKRQLEVIEAKDKAKRDFRHKNNLDTAEALMKQMAYNENQKQNQFEMNLLADQQEIDECNAAIQAEEDKQRRRAEDAHRRGREVLAFNSKYKYIAEEQAQKQRDQDAILLNYALRKEREQIEEEERKKQAGAEAAKQYRKYLEEMMIKEAEDTGFVDEINKREAEKVFKARDDALQARQDARDYLMKLVDAGRKEQIRHKHEQAIKEKEEGKVFASKFIVDVKEGIEKDAKAVLMRRQKAEDNNSLLQKQIAMRKMQEDLVKQETYLEEKRMKHIERQHQQRLSVQGGTVRLKFPISHSDL